MSSVLDRLRAAVSCLRGRTVLFNAEFNAAGELVSPYGQRVHLVRCEHVTINVSHWPEEAQASLFGTSTEQSMELESGRTYPLRNLLAAEVQS